MIVALGLLALGLAWLLPGHDFPWTGFQQESLAAGGALLIALAAIVARPPWPRSLPALSGLAFLLAAVPIAQWAAGMLAFGSDAWLSSLYLVALGLAVWVGFRLALLDVRFANALLGLLAAGALATCTIGMAQWLQWRPGSLIHPLSPGDRVYGNFLQPNHQACLLGLGLAGLAGLRERGVLLRVFVAAGAAYLLFGLALTRSRVGWLIAVVLFVLWLALRRRCQLKLSAGTVAGCLMFYAAAWWAVPHLTQQAVGGSTMPMSARAAADSRLLHWQILWDALLRAPWHGYGWLQTSAAQQAAALDHPPTYEWPSSSHNQALDLLVWSGLPIGLLAVAVLLWWFAHALRACRDGASWGLIAALGVLVGYAMVEFPLAYAYFLLPAGLIAGALQARVEQPAAQVRGARSIALALAALLAAALGWIGAEYVRLEEGVQRARYRDAGFAQTVPVPDVKLLDGPREYLRLWATKNAQGDPDADVAWLRTVSLRYATPPALLRYAAASAVRGDAAAAHRTLAILCRTAKPAQCDDARAYWAGLAEQHAGLRAVAFPATPRR